MGRLRPEDLIREHPEHDFLIADKRFASPYMLAAHQAFYDFAAGHTTSTSHVLDAGCGTGFGSERLAQSAGFAIGVDVKPLLTRYAAQHHGSNGLRLAAMDGCEMAFGDHSFDVVVVNELLEHLPEHRPFLLEVRRVLKPGGVFVCATVNRAHTFGSGEDPLNPHHYREFSASEYRGELERYFADVALLGQGFGAQFERYSSHPGARAIEWALVRLGMKQRIRPSLRIRVRSLLTGSHPHGDGEGQFTVSDVAVESALYLVAVCRAPGPGQALAASRLPSSERPWRVR